MARQLQSTRIQSNATHIDIDYEGNATLYTITRDWKGAVRRVSVSLDKEQAQGMIEVLSDYLKVVE